MAETINDDLLGSLTWDFERHEWHGRAVTARGLAFDLWIETGAWDMIHPIDDAKVDRTISSASRQAFLRVRDSEPQVREGMVDEFVPLHADGHGEPISPVEFQARLQMESVQVFQDGAVELFYGDDGMFGGHSLIAHLDSSGVIERGEMFG